MRFLKGFLLSLGLMLLAGCLLFVFAPMLMEGGGSGLIFTILMYAFSIPFILIVYYGAKKIRKGEKAFGLGIMLLPAILCAIYIVLLTIFFIVLSSWGGVGFG